MTPVTMATKFGTKLAITRLVEEFHQILFKIATVGAMTDRQTDASDLIICPMLCNSNGTDKKEVRSNDYHVFA